MSASDSEEVELDTEDLENAPLPQPLSTSPPPTHGQLSQPDRHAKGAKGATNNLLPVNAQDSRLAEIHLGSSESLFDTGSQQSDTASQYTAAERRSIFLNTATNL